MHDRGAFSPLLALLVALVVCPAAQAVSTVGSERELAEMLANGVRDGTVEWMTTGADRFPVIVREAERELAVGVVLIVPEPGAHADWPEVVRPLRLGLPAQGWQTVAVQMPRAADDGDYADPERAAARLAFMVEGLVAGKVERIVVLAHGRAYRVVVTWLAEALTLPPKYLNGLALVSPALPAASAAGVVPADPLVETMLPLLEVRGSEDRADVRALMREHQRRAARGELMTRREVLIDGARSDYAAQADLLVRRVRGWLSRLPTPAEPPAQ